MRRAFFLDRDGVINVDYGYVGHWSEFVFVPGVIPALSRLRQAGFLLILTTNQSGIGRGRYTESVFLYLTARMQRSLTAQGAQFDAIYYCPHHPQAQLAAYRRPCHGRKPQPGMLEQAAGDFNLDLTQCVMAGDHASDLQAAAAAGVERLYLVGENLKTEAVLVPGARCYQDLAALVAKEF